MQLAFVEELLEMMRYEFVQKVHPMIARQGQVYMSLPSTFDQHFQVLLTKWEQKQREH